MTWISSQVLQFSPYALMPQYHSRSTPTFPSWCLRARSSRSTPRRPQTSRAGSSCSWMLWRSAGALWVDWLTAQLCATVRAHFAQVSPSCPSCSPQLPHQLLWRAPARSNSRQLAKIHQQLLAAAFESLEEGWEVGLALFHLEEENIS